MNVSLPLLESRDALWKVETNGINPIATQARHGSARDLFWVWFAGNLSFTYVVIGAVVWSYGLSLWQSLLVLAIGLSSFVVIGYLGIPGVATGLPTMAFSARYFGKQGNRVMASVSWLNMVGWETIVLIVASFTVATMLHLIFGVGSTALWLVVSLMFSGMLEFSLAFIGHATIEYLQRWVSYIFGFLTLVILLTLLPHVNWHDVWFHPSGPWLAGVIPSITVVVAVSALSWVTTAADYTRYLPEETSHRRVVSATTWGAIIPTALLMAVGLLLGQSAPALANATNPVELLLHWLPAWAQVPYLLITLVGILAGGVLCAYSSGLSLLAAGIKMPRSRTIAVDGIISVAASLYVLLISQGFIVNFEGFLSLVAALLAPWAAIALLNVRLSIRVSGTPAIVSWLAGTILGLATTSTVIFTGPLAVGIFRESSLGYLVGFVVTAVIYHIWTFKQNPLVLNQ
jgi:purine-cytosine permease-like protein